MIKEADKAVASVDLDNKGTGLAIMALWLKTNALLKIGKNAEALAAIEKAEEIVDHVSRWTNSGTNNSSKRRRNTGRVWCSGRWEIQRKRKNVSIMPYIELRKYLNLQKQEIGKNPKPTDLRSL